MTIWIGQKQKKGKRKNGAVQKRKIGSSMGQRPGVRRIFRRRERGKSGRGDKKPNKEKKALIKKKGGECGHKGVQHPTKGQKARDVCWCEKRQKAGGKGDTEEKIVFIGGRETKVLRL